MTVVIGTETEDGQVLMAFDGCVVHDQSRFDQTRFEKVVSIGPWAIGWSGFPHLGHLLLSGGSEVFGDLAPGETDPLEFFRLGRRIRELLRADGWKNAAQEGPENLEADLLIGADGSGLWYVDVHGSPYRIDPGTAVAVGSGSPEAQAAHRALCRLRPGSGLTSAEELLLAVEVAGDVDIYCGPPYSVGVVNGSGFEPIELPARRPRPPVQVLGSFAGG